MGKVVFNVVITPSAQHDLDRILDYTQQEWGLRQMKVYGAKLAAALKQIQHQPYSGVAVSEVGIGMRRLVVGSHAVFYRPQEKSIIIYRFAHQSVNWERLYVG